MASSKRGTNGEPVCTKTFELNNGLKMPCIGLGTYRIRNHDDIMSCVDYALGAGYRLFDTAAVYGNERHLRSAFQKFLPKYGLERDDIFITTKLAPSDHGGEGVTENAYFRSVENLGLEYVDLYLIHFPGSARIQVSDPRNRELRDRTWEKLAEIYDSGKVKAIGVSNYTLRHLKELLKNSHGVEPSVNQVEWHPYYHQQELLNFCNENEIVLQAYCSLGGTSSNNLNLMNDPTVVAIAKKLNVSVSQLLLAWAVQQGVAVIPKSTNQAHIQNNIDLNFTIPEGDLKALNNLSNRVKYAWNPEDVA